MASVRSEPDCSLSTLGTFSLRARGCDLQSPSTQKARALLTYLVLHRASDVSRERLLDVFWPEADPQRARDSLNTAMHSIRRCFRTAGFDPDDFVFANKAVVRWKSVIEVDVERLEHASEDADESHTRDALTAYRGDFLEGDYDEWTVTQRERAAENYERILSRAVRITREPQIAKRLLARNPYDEDAYAALIDAELAAGRALSAAQMLAQCRKALAEIDVEPTPSFLSRFASIERAPKRPQPAIDVPFVGRDLQYAQIFDAIEGTGNSRLLVVEGDPGIGKSALLERAAANAISSGIPVLSVRALAGDLRAFGTWRTLYESLCGHELSTFVREAQGDVVTAIACDVVANLPPSAVLFVDDAQYLSADSLEVLSAIVKRASLTDDHAIVVATRPEGLSALLGRLGDAANAVLHLAPLSSTEVENAIALASIDLGDDVRKLLERRSGGHPLYLKALLGQLARSGSLQREAGRWRLVHEEPVLEVPASLAHLIEARIRSRGDDAVLVACALALEPMATVSELAGATRFEELRVLDALDDLLGYRIVLEAMEGPRQFVFSHDLIQEVALGLLTIARRIQLHANFTEVLSTSEARDRDARRARHLRACARYEEAASAFIAAAHETLEWLAPHVTLEICEDGLACTARLADSPSVHRQRSELHQLASAAHRMLWNLDGCLHAAQRGVDCARASENPVCLAEALSVLKHANILTEVDMETHLQVVREIGAIAGQLGDEALYIRALIDESNIYCVQQMPERMRVVADRAFLLARGLQHDRLIASAGLQVVTLQAYWWMFDRVEEVIAPLRECAVRLEWGVRAPCLLVLSQLLGELHRYDEAQRELNAVSAALGEPEYAHDALTAAIPRPEVAIRVDYFQASLDARRGDWDTGLERFARYRPLYAQVLSEERYCDLFTYANIDLLLGRGRPEDNGEALRLFQSSKHLWVHEQGFQPYHAPSIIEARVACRNRLAGAETLVEQAIDDLERFAAVIPYGADVGFERLAAAAREIGARAHATRAQALRERYHAAHIAAAGDAWGGLPLPV